MSRRGPVASLHDDAYAHVVARLAEKRRKAGLTQQAVADRLGWRQAVIARIEGKQRRMDVIEYLRLAEAIGFDPVRLLREIKAELEERGEL